VCGERSSSHVLLRERFGGAAIFYRVIGVLDVLLWCCQRSFVLICLVVPFGVRAGKK